MPIANSMRSAGQHVNIFDLGGRASPGGGTGLVAGLCNQPVDLADIGGIADAGRVGVVVRIAGWLEAALLRLRGVSPGAAG